MKEFWGVNQGTRKELGQNGLTDISKWRRQNGTNQHDRVRQNGGGNLGQNGLGDIADTIGEGKRKLIRLKRVGLLIF
ncbi:hypothetical protein [Bacillus norwichensis]|uniref:Uncharacterized protein n=1 Tax=Bacillus norwichensis TaxID=2762217 RepID=A0ABR8VIL4_9BACI|nr:hypothetical protein [Bacillus norwichensis]MBD8004563.1 hypothetical protein [Bacillus norwichensis]